jgi:hypothetical protein
MALRRRRLDQIQVKGRTPLAYPRIVEWRPWAVVKTIRPPTRDADVPTKKKAPPKQSQNFPQPVHKN